MLRPDKVWAVISDIPGSAATLSGIDSIQMLTRRTLWRGHPLEGNPHHDGPLRNGGDVGRPGRARRRPGSTTVKALQGGADYTSRFTLAERDGGTDLTLTFGAEVVRPTLFSRIAMALFGKIGMSITERRWPRTGRNCGEGRVPLMASPHGQARQAGRLQARSGRKGAKGDSTQAAPVRLEELRDEPAPDFQRGERYDGAGTAALMPTAWS